LKNTTLSSVIRPVIGIHC